MTRALTRRVRGARIGPRVRAEAALLIAAGVAKAEVARHLGIARESLRQFGLGDGGELWLHWVEVARQRLASGVPHHRVVDELLDTVEIRAPEPDPAGAWTAIQNLARLLAARARVWNEERGEELLESDPDGVLALAAAHAGEPAPGPGCERRGGIIKALADACVAVPCCDCNGLAELQSRGTFVPWKEPKGELQ